MAGADAGATGDVVIVGTQAADRISLSVSRGMLVLSVNGRRQRLSLAGITGILLASIVTAVIDRMLMPASLSIPILVIAVLVSIVVGVLAGILPAYRGAHLDPVESLRYE